MTPRLLTQPEVAAILRCSTAKVKRLRLTGQLPYLPGRPVMISESDLTAYIADATRPAARPEPTEKVAAAPDNRQMTDARKWALQAVLLRRHSRKRPKP